MNVICRKAIIVSLCSRAKFTTNQDIAVWSSLCRGLTSYSTAETGSKEHIDDLVKQNKVVVFMKGVPEQPMCGFSNVVMQILRMHGVDKFSTHNVLDDDAIRKGIKEYSNWPTIPQIYFNGEFIGGSDIILQMHQDGDLVEELQKLGIRSALLDEGKTD